MFGYNYLLIITNCHCFPESRAWKSTGHRGRLPTRAAAPPPEPAHAHGLQADGDMISDDRPTS
ncbi:MAG: hypothetical protein WCW68_13300 [Methanothrix sp.]